MTLYLFLFKKIFLFNNEETQSLIRTGLGIRFQNLKKNEIKKNVFDTCSLVQKYMSTIDQKFI